MDYLFTSARLGFRTWHEADILPMAAINADPEVMEFFPGVLTVEQTADFVRRMQQQMQDKGYCYFAADRLDNGAFIGIIGISDKTFEASFTPCIDIGWRISSREWNKGYATEGAKACLEYAFNRLKLEKVYAITPEINKKSIHIMQRIGMHYADTFLHPQLNDDERLQSCALYELTAAQHAAGKII